MRFVVRRSMKDGDVVGNRVKVWDVVVRGFHWSLVVTFFACYFTGDALDLLHAYLGYGILLLLGVRIVWGVIGTRYARFSNFIYGWEKVRAYMVGLMTRRPPHYLGHNPAAGWMVVLLLLFLFLTCWSGLEAYGTEGHGPLAQRDLWAANADEGRSDDSEDELWGELHEVLADVTLFLVFFHILGVIVSSLLHRENLVRGMWTGYKKSTGNDQSSIE